MTLQRLLIILYSLFEQKLISKRKYIMGHLELEVKILNIDVLSTCKNIEKLGGVFLQNSLQQLYTYDLPTISGRYNEFISQIKNSQNEVKYMVAIDNVKQLLFELDNILNTRDRECIRTILGIDNLENIIFEEDMIEKLSSYEMMRFMKNYQTNSNKWIRLRKTNDKVTLATKHILANNDSCLQQMLETEIEVSSFEGTKDLLTQLGFSYKSYQEKKRISYQLLNHQIDIDTWPDIPSYMEIEGESESDISTILEMLGYTMKDTVSCAADEVYRLYGKDMFESRELKFIR